MKKIIAIDSQNIAKTVRDKDLPYFPHREFQKLVVGPNGDSDVLEHMATVVRMVAQDDSPEAIAEVTERFNNKCHALQMSGVTVIESPAKRTPDGGYKQSDDQRLVIATMSRCFRLRPDFLVLVAADGDYAPMVEELRREGIRTEVVASPANLASDLKKVAWSTIDLDDILEAIKEEM